MEFLVALLGVAVWFVVFVRKVYFLGTVGESFDRRIIRSCRDNGVDFDFAYKQIRARQNLIKKRDELSELDPAFAKLIPVEQFSTVIKVMYEKSN